MSKQESSKLWGGRFSESADPVMEKFNSSISIDKRMWSEDLAGSVAWAQAIAQQGILTTEECDQIKSGLKQIRSEWEQGEFKLLPGDEDIHTAHERRLKELVGPVGGKLHTGRSRNDQVVTDMRLWLRNAISAMQRQLVTVIGCFVTRAEREIDVLMPGYTHLQRAQPIRWSQWLLSYTFMLRRDYDRLTSLESRVNLSPLGCGALAGNPFGIDREWLSEELGFKGIMLNSLDATSSRDFIVEFLSSASLMNVHLSKLAEDLILFCSKEFNFVSLSDAFSSGSSLMPQKRNADSLELIRGKAGTVSGLCFGFMMSLKGLPSTYNKDLQEDKQAMFNAYDTLMDVLQITAGVMTTLTVHPEKCLDALSPDMLATDLAYYLVKQGVAFREAHGLAGKCVALSEKNKCKLNTLSLEELRTVSKEFGEDVMSLWDYENSVEQYNSSGGTGSVSVRRQLQVLRSWIDSTED